MTIDKEVTGGEAAGPCMLAAHGETPDGSTSSGILALRQARRLAVLEFARRAKAHAAQAAVQAALARSVAEIARQDLAESQARVAAGLGG